MRLARRAWAFVVARQPWSVLVPLLAAQWLALLALALTVRHNGWLYYQGGDQTWYWTGARLLSHGTLPVTTVGYAWSYLISPLALILGPNVLSGLPPVIVLNALVLLPVALLCVYGIAVRIGGRLFGYWAAGLWIAIPYLAIPLFDHRYHQKYVEITLPQQLGLTVLADFPSTVGVLLTAYLVVRALDTHDWRDAALAGLAAGFTIGIKPSTALFLVAAVLTLVVARRWRQTAVFLGLLAPGLIVLALWKARGLGNLPAFSSYGGGAAGTTAAIDPGLPAASLTSPFHRYLNLDWHQLWLNMDGVREFFWAVRPLEFVPFAGLIAIGRRSWPKALLVFAWFMTFFLLKGTDSKANVADASFFRLLMPSFPAFLLLLAAIPLLVPTFSLTRRLLVVPAVTRRAGNRVLAAAAVLVFLVPLILVAGTSAQAGPTAVSYPDQNVYVPVARSFHLRVAGTGGTRQLSWTAPYSGSSNVFYDVFRSRAVFPDPSGNGRRKTIEGVACRDRAHGSSQLCNLFMNPVGATFGTRWRDRPPPGRWTYRVGLSANWLNNPAQGDVLLLSDPVTITVS
jgi:Dolichyl-phosphate-mannose-protein mannosyltransferase